MLKRIGRVFDEYDALLTVSVICAFWFWVVVEVLDYPINN